VVEPYHGVHAWSAPSCTSQSRVPRNDVPRTRAPDIRLWSIVLRLRHPLKTRSLRSALEAIGAVAAAAGLGGSVRLLPWLLDPAVTYRLAAPFARGVLLLAGEAAILVGWPVGWALASAQLVESGERRALATLGESPTRTLLRLAPQAAVFACVLGLVSFAGGREASAPGKVLTDLVTRGRESCQAVGRATTYAVPFSGMTWLCSPGALPRLVGRGPGALSNVTFTARAAWTAGDLREIGLDEARLHLDSGGGIDVRVRALWLHGLAPFAQASSVPPVARAVGLALAAAIAATASALGVLSGALRGRLAAIVVAASGALGALGSMRSIERMDGIWFAMCLPPLAALAAALLSMGVLSRLPMRMWAASK
jgi:hypothetical protein